jgi:hypothetical protein
MMKRLGLLAMAAVAVSCVGCWPQGPKLDVLEDVRDHDIVFRAEVDYVHKSPGHWSTTNVAMQDVTYVVTDMYKGPMLQLGKPVIVHHILAGGGPAEDDDFPQLDPKLIKPGREVILFAQMRFPGLKDGLYVLGHDPTGVVFLNRPPPVPAAARALAERNAAQPDGPSADSPKAGAKVDGEPDEEATGEAIEEGPEGVVEEAPDPDEPPVPAPQPQPQQATILVDIPCPLFNTVQAEDAIAAPLRDALSRMDFVDRIRTVAAKGQTDVYILVTHEGDVETLVAALDKKIRRMRLPDAAVERNVTLAEPGWTPPAITPSRPIRVRLQPAELRGRGLNQEAVVAAVRNVSVPREGEDMIRLDTVRNQVILVDGEEIRLGDIATAEISPNVSHIVRDWPGDQE